MTQQGGYRNTVSSLQKAAYGTGTTRTAPSPKKHIKRPSATKILKVVLDDEASSFGTTTVATAAKYASSDDDPTIMEEGQEAMLIEDLQQKMTMMTETDAVKQETTGNDGGENNAHKHDNTDKPKPKPRKSTRRVVQQVLLVPTNGDLLMERYRQASQRSLKARALLDEALNWDSTVLHRDRLATAAFTEAGKARLLIEPEKTPELIAMLTDAKVKGEEEAFRAIDFKIKQLVPAVKLPGDVAHPVGVSAVSMDSSSSSKHKSSRCPSSSEDEALTVSDSIMLTKDPALQCFQNMFNPHVTIMSGGFEDYEEEETDIIDEEDAAEEHVYRSKQYLEFILPDLGDVRDDDSMAPKADINPRAVLQQYQQQIRSSCDESGLGEISSLGFDESHSLDIISTNEEDADEVFSMSSLNEIMDAPLDEFVPERIMNMPSMKRKKLTIKMSFGGKSLRNSESMTSKSPFHKTTTPRADDEKQPAKNEKNSSNSAKENVKEQATTPTTPRDDKKRNTLSFGKKRSSHHHHPSILSSGDDHTNNAGGFLRRFRSNKKKNGEHGKQLRMIAPVLSDLSDGQSKVSNTADSKTPFDGKNPETKGIKDTVREVIMAKEGHETLGSVNEETTTGTEKDQGIATTTTTPEAELQVIKIDSLGSSSQDDEDRYKVDLPSEEQEDEMDENIEAQPALVDCSPTSLGSDENGHSRYSPIHASESQEDDVLQNRDSLDENEKDTVDIKENAAPVEANKPTSKDETEQTTTADETVANKTSDPSSEVAVAPVKAASAKKGKKKLRRSLIGLFHHRNEADEANTDVPKPKESAVLKETVLQPTRLPSALNQASKKKPSSLQASLKKSKEKAETTKTPPEERKKGQRRVSTSLRKHSAPSKDEVSQDTAKVMLPKNKTETAKHPLKEAPKDITRLQTTRRSSLKTALESTPDTAVIMAAGTFDGKRAKPKRDKESCAARPIEGVKSTKKSKMEKTNVKKQGLETGSHSNAAPTSAGKGKPHPSNSGRRKQKEAGKHNTKRLDHRRQKPTKRNPVTEKTTLQALNINNKSGGLQATRWVNNLNFSKKRKDQAKLPSIVKEKPAVANNFAHQRSVVSDAITPRAGNASGAHCKKAAPLPSSVPKGLSHATATSRTTLESSTPSMVVNPLLPYQLVKQLEEQSKRGSVDEFSAQEAAERSIMLSHVKAIARSMGSEVTTRSIPTVNETPSSEKENAASVASSITGQSSLSMLRDRSAPVVKRPQGPFVTIPIVRGESPRVALSTQSSISTAGTAPSSMKTGKRAPDADGLNARAKDVRDVLLGEDLEDAESFGEERSRSFLSRISQGTYRQDFDLPDP